MPQKLGLGQAEAGNLGFLHGPQEPKFPEPSPALTEGEEADVRRGGGT